MADHIQSDACKKEGCQLEKNGFCIEHNFEKERRVDLSKWMQKMGDWAVSVDKKLTRIFTVFSIVGSIGLLIIAGSFVYTTLVWNHATNEAQALRSQVLQDNREIQKQIGNLITVSAELTSITSTQININRETTRKFDKVIDKYEEVRERQYEHETKYNSWGDRRNEKLKENE